MSGLRIDRLSRSRPTDKFNVLIHHHIDLLFHPNPGDKIALRRRLKLVAQPLSLQDAYQNALPIPLLLAIQSPAKKYPD